MRYSDPAARSDIDVAVAALESNGFKVVVVPTVEEAKTAVLELIPEGSEVFTNSSVTVDQSGLGEVINESGRYVSGRNKMLALAEDEGKKREMKQIAATPDYALGSVHAITQDGKLVMASGSGSQIPSVSYGAENAVFVVGSQKIVKDLNEGLSRLNEHTIPLEDERAQKAYGRGARFSKLFVYNNELPGRVTVIISEEPIGY